MKELRNWIRRLTGAELVRANKEYPLFASDHEGLAIIEEEVMEAKEDYNLIGLNLGCLKGLIYNDETDVTDIIDELETAATECACECVQIAAMCRKFKQGRAEVEHNFILDGDALFDDGTTSFAYRNYIRDLKSMGGINE